MGAVYEETLGRPLPEERREALARWLEDVFRAGRAAWPALVVPPDEFARAVAKHAVAAGSSEPVLLPAHAADFYLAVACVIDAPQAAEALRTGPLAEVPRYVGSRAPTDDVEQLVAIRLLVREGERPPRIAEYGGKGPLGAFVRVVATRIALNLQRRREPREDAALLPLGEAPEVDFSRFRYRDEFKSAFEDALAELSPEERLLLRLHSIERMRGDDIARLLEVDRSTIVRRLQRARERLFDATRAAMMDRLRLSAAEFESLARDVQSGIDLTLSRLFA